jgi:hypothetical protein
MKTCIARFLWIAVTIVIVVGTAIASEKIVEKVAQGTMPAGTRVHAVLSPTPPPPPGPHVFFPDRGEAPPVVEGPFVAPTGPDIPGTAPGLPDSSPINPDAGLTFYVNNGLGTSFGYAIPDEPSAAAGSDQAAGYTILYTGNSYAAVSNDGGSIFNFMDPYTLFPEENGGFCCDQRAAYSAGYDLFIWVLTYYPDSNTNTVRIAVATPTGAQNGSWCYYGFQPSDIGYPNGDFFDYPYLATSNNDLYFSTNVYTVGGSFKQTSILRIPLQPLTTCSGFSYNYFNDPNGLFNYTLGHGATDTMYWASIYNNSKVRVFSWPESSGSITHSDQNVTSWKPGSSSCDDPAGTNWCQRSQWKMGAAWIRQSIGDDALGFMWNGAACTDSSCGYSRPQTYIRVLRFDENLNLINEPDIWNPNYAFQFAGVSTNGRGAVGGVFFWGGGGNYPNLNAFIWDGQSCDPYSCGWENYWAAGSSASSTGWGDYIEAEQDYPSVDRWDATGFNDSGLGVTPQYMQFGRSGGDGSQTGSAPQTEKWFSPPPYRWGPETQTEE